jgi:glycosyltransferase involved in cell wall biosynthesis
MSGAEALVHPSLYEGFGLTPIQAMAANCPVITSNAASLPEVVGNAGEYFSPTELEQLVEVMNRLVSEPGMKTRLREKGLQHAQKYTWERTAGLTLPVLTRWE